MRIWQIHPGLGYLWLPTPENSKQKPSSKTHQRARERLCLPPFATIFQQLFDFLLVSGLGVHPRIHATISVIFGGFHVWLRIPLSTLTSRQLHERPPRRRRKAHGERRRSPSSGAHYQTDRWWKGAKFTELGPKDFNWFPILKGITYALWMI